MMPILGRPISASLAPNAESDDVLRALALLVLPHRWVHGEFPQRVKAWFGKHLSTPYVYLFNSGRSALFALLSCAGIGKGDEVLVPAFTCVAVPNSVCWTGATPVYVDIDRTYNMDPADAAKKITKRTRAIIIQHTFGIPADTALIGLARQHSLFIIEDCAHSLGATINGIKVGTLGDGAIFSFGRDKVISSVFGGAATLTDAGRRISRRMDAYEKSLQYPSPFWTWQQIVHVAAFALILPLYFSVGKVLLVLLQRLHVLSVPVSREEKQGKQPDDFPRRLPNALAHLALFQLQKLKRFNANRRSIAKLYTKSLAHRGDVNAPAFAPGATYLRFPIEVANPSPVMQKAKSGGVLLGHRYGNMIDPRGVDFAAIGYRPGSCPAAERAAR